MTTTYNATNNKDDFGPRDCINIYNLTDSQFSNFLERAGSKLLGNLKRNCSWHDLMISLLLVLNNFMKNLSSTKSNDLRSDFFKGQASRPWRGAIRRFTAKRESLNQNVLP